MTAQDILTMIPSLTIMGLFAFYRNDILCLWGCNPHIQAIVDSARFTIQSYVWTIQSYVWTIKSHTYTFVRYVMPFVSSMSEVSRQIIGQWAQRGIEQFQQIDSSQWTMYLYILYTITFTMVLYMGLLADTQESSIRQHRKKHVKVVDHRPITRSMSRKILNGSV